jgi:transposase
LVQRIEVITGKERRRRWSAEEKARLVAETLKPGAVISHVARRNGVAESCLYAWRRQAAQGLAGRRAPEEASAVLIPVAVDPGETGEPAEPADPDPSPPGDERAVITFPDGTRLEIGAGYPLALLGALVAAVQGRR